ncbi:transcriptional regulator GlxA family with amidase domain [Friedmanniella endophytica]|uniref:Transcriptional regulator GlxA family with amidase domain n=1 Tax=Microlunatus kandeliicorticis TaxID=1759536 RepID=A0A7W3ISU3_9ACTN|nr:helix-turn-helix domain-containing protein [Microlunatus kandeliicorticis]MBA8794530.1 transcriptional regulator GlxA family with amidase domain [Microlunatus kandeliicorticis]
MSLRVVSVVLVEPVAVFEFSVAVEVFGITRPEDGIPDLDFRVCALDPSRPLQAKSLAPFAIQASHGLDGVAGSDLVIVAATPIRSDDDYPGEVLDALRSAHAAGATILSLCSGSFVLGAAGLLDGRRCTTHWMYVDAMRRRFPEVEVDGDVLFVDDGDIVTSAGTAAGIDAALHLVRRELGSEIAVRIARRMVVPPQRDGGQAQFVPTPLPECRADSLADLLTWLVDHLAEEHTAASLARRAMMSERTFARRFAAETGTTPHKWLTQQRVLQARRLLEETDLGIEQVADTVGFNSAVVLRDHFRRQVGVAPVDYRRRFAVRSA